MINSPIRMLVAAALVTFNWFVAAQSPAQLPAETPVQSTVQESRGALLYTTHCVACHTTQMHWRADKLATDWNSLQFQVRRWQGNAGLQWADADITEVARYLNDTIYQYPQTANRVGVFHPRSSSTSPR